jgi:hypothetical protein
MLHPRNSTGAHLEEVCFLEFGLYIVYQLLTRLCQGIAHAEVVNHDICIRLSRFEGVVQSLYARSFEEFLVECQCVGALALAHTLITNVCRNRCHSEAPLCVSNSMGDSSRVLYGNALQRRVRAAHSAAEASRATNVSKRTPADERAIKLVVNACARDCEHAWHVRVASGR